MSGPVIGVEAGFNWQQDIFVYGIEGDIGISALSGNDSGFLGALDSIQGYVGGSIRGRAGIALDRVLLYGTAGIAFQTQRYTSSPTGGGGTATFDEVLVGFVGGAGAEYAVTDDVSLKVEVLFKNFGTRTYSDPVVYPGQTWTGQLSTTEFRAGANFRF